MKEHIVRVGPVHAGIIEPGVFEFTCSGERVDSLAIELGFQHRGIEQLIIEAATSGSSLKMMCLAEQVAGDSTIAHSMAMAEIIENGECSRMIKAERDVALEMERVAMNIADIGALSGDIAYQTAQVACEALRTLVINMMQRLCGNRFGRTLIRPRGSYYRIDLACKDDIVATMSGVGGRMVAIRGAMMNSPSVLSRLEDICVMGQSVGRYSGDLKSRVEIRFVEVENSIARILMLCKRLSGWWFEGHSAPDYSLRLEPNTKYRARAAGWRGPVKHSCVTDSTGLIVKYKIDDPSVKLWVALSESMIGGDISDFPVNNKSFNLSYSATDK